MSKQPDMNALYDFLKTVGPFQWHGNDCYDFTNKAWEAMYGHPWSTGWEKLFLDENGKYRSFEDSLEAFGVASMDEAIDRHLERETRVVPKKGSLVTMEADNKAVGPSALGIAVGKHAAFLQKDGVIMVPISQIQNAWVNKCD